MASSPPKGRRVRVILLVCALGLIALSIALGLFHKTPWTISPAEKARKNPLSASEVNLTAARAVYGEKCANCHGDKGKGDGSDAMMYDPAPSDLTDATQIGKLTDGAIFYQITEGRKPMPSFRKKLTDEQRWQLVLLVRELAAGRASLPTQKQEEKK